MGRVLGRPCGGTVTVSYLALRPRRVGKHLIRELDGYRSARRGAYRVIYRIDETGRTVHVVRIDHRADVYRTR